MGRTSKGILLLLIAILAALNLIIVEAAFAQSTPKPQLPNFTLEVVEHSYDLPPVYEIDQFTGENITISEGANYQWRTLDFTIANQLVPSGNSLYFNIRYRGQYASDWTNVYYEGRYVAAQSGKYSTIPFLISGHMPSSQGDLYHLIIPEGATVNFQVEALIGSITRGSTQFGSGDVFSGEASGWSNARTITTPQASASISPSTNPTPPSTIPELPFIIVILIIVAWTLAIPVFKRKAPRIDLVTINK